MAVVLGEAPASHEAVDDTGELVAVDGAQLEEPAGQVPVAPLSTLEYRHVERAVHRLRVVGGPVQLHGREHAVGIEVEVATRLPEHRLGDVRAVDEVVAAGLMAVTAVVLDQLPDECALRVPDGQTRPQGLRPRHQVQLGGQPSMVALLGLDQSMEVPLEGLPVSPGGAVDPLEHRLLLVAAPVGPSDLLKGEVPEAPGGWHVRAEAEVYEALTVAVVGDGTIARRLAGQLAGGGAGRDLLDDLALVGMPGEQFQRLGRIGLVAFEGLVGIDDEAHTHLDRLQVLVAEGGATGQLEVVVEAVLDRWADGVGGAGPQVQHGLGQHVGRRMPDRVEPVIAARRHDRHRGPVR